MRAAIFGLAVVLLAGAAWWVLVLRNAPDAPAAREAPPPVAVYDDGSTAERRYLSLRAATEWNVAPAETYYDLFELAVLRGLWSEAADHAADALEHGPDAPDADGVRIAAAFFPALGGNDLDAARSAFRQAEALLRDRPEDRGASLVAIYWLLREGRGEQALPLIDAAIAREPQVYEYDELRLAAVQRIGDEDRIGDQLATLHAKYPARADVMEWLVQWLVAQGRIDDASGVLFEDTQRMAANAERIPAHVAFLREHEGAEGAAAEIGRLLQAEPGMNGAERYRAGLADIQYDLGRVQEAIDTMAAVAHGDGPPAVRSAATVRLARMLEATGDRARARSEIDALLDWDEVNADARKMRAAWRIEDGDAEAALEDLRTAAPERLRDVELATLMGEAYLLRGSPALAGEHFALAFEYSSSGAEEAVRFSDFLVSEGQFEVANRVLDLALASHRDDIRLLERAVRVSSELGDRSRYEDFAARLRALEGPSGRQLDADSP